MDCTFSVSSHMVTSLFSIWHPGRLLSGRLLNMETEDSGSTRHTKPSDIICSRWSQKKLLTTVCYPTSHSMAIFPNSDLTVVG